MCLLSLALPGAQSRRSPSACSEPVYPCRSRGHEAVAGCTQSSAAAGLPAWPRAALRRRTRPRRMPRRQRWASGGVPVGRHVGAGALRLALGSGTVTCRRRKAEPTQCSQCGWRAGWRFVVWHGLCAERCVRSVHESRVVQPMDFGSALEARLQSGLAIVRRIRRVPES